MAEIVRRNVELWVTGSLLALTLAVGGAGLSFPLLQMLLGLAALAAAAYYVLRPAPARLSFTRPFLILIACAFLLPVLQLIPLPPAIWSHLPGRETAVQLDRLLGWQVWRPWSLDIEGTIRALLVLIPGAVIFVGCTRLGTNDRLRLMEIVLAFALFGALLGIAQYASGGRFTPFPSAHLGFPIGLFVNRNHQAVSLLAAIPLAAALSVVRPYKGVGRFSAQVVALSVMLIFAITIVATTSRMALVLLPVVLAVALALLFLRQSLLRFVIPSLLGLAGLTILIWVNNGFTRNFARFSSFNDARFNYWADVQWALGHYGLAGTGIGTFVPVQKSAESLESVTPAILNHAHNDFIELLLEGGIPAAILMVAFFILIAIAVRRKWRARENRQSLVLGTAAAAGIAATLVFSLVDYPLRMPAIAADFALLVAMMLPPRKVQPGARLERSKSLRTAALVILLCAAVLAVQAGVSGRQLLSGNPDYAAQWAPWSTEAQERLATQALIVSNDPSTAFAKARRALRLSPIDAPAIRTMGILTGAADQRKSYNLMYLAVVLGWRDPITNMWAVEAARQANQPDVAVQRAEALYRQHQFLPEATAALLQPPIAEQAKAMLIHDLAAHPDWRRGFLRSSGRLPAGSVPAFVSLVIALDGTRAPATLDEAGPLLDRLSDQASAPLRQSLWLSLHAHGLIANGGFERSTTYRGPELPSDWDMSEEDISSMSIDRPGFGGRGSALRLYDSRYDTPLIAQSMMLRPGTYALSYRVRSAGGANTVARWELRCLETGANSYFDAPVRGDSQWQSIRAAITVPIQECQNQRLAFELTGPKQSGPVWLDEVALDQAILTSR